MKKLISLLAVFTVSICAFAQEKYVVGSMEPSDNLEIQATSSIKLTLGADGGWSIKELSLMDDMTNYVTGKSNPVHTDDAGSSTGYSADNKLLPTIGTYYILDTSKDGRLAFYVLLNAVKEFFIVDGSDGTNLTKNVNIEFTQSDGTVLTATEGNKGGLTVSEKLYGSVTFDVEANKQYYVFCGGSKLGFYGLEFTESEPTGLDDPNVVPEGIYPAKNVVWGPVTWKNANNRKDQSNGDMLFLMGSGNGYSELNAEVVWNEAQGTNVTRPYYKYINYEEGETGVPEYGLCYKFTPWMDGELKVCVWINKANRKTYVVKASTGEPLVPYVDYNFEGYINGQYTNTDEPVIDPETGVQKIDNAGNPVFVQHPTFFTAEEIKARHDEQFVQDGVDTNPYVIDKGNQLIWGWITINVHSGESYIIYQQSSQIGFGGYEFNGENYQVVTGTPEAPVFAPEFAAVIDGSIIGKVNGEEVVIGGAVKEEFLSEKGSVVYFGTGSMNVEAVASAAVQSLEADVEDIVQLLGDVDGSGQINVTDVALIIDEILGRNPRNFNAAMADVDNNNQINVVDVVLVIDNILGKINLNRAQADAGVVGSIALSSPNTIALNNPTAYTAFQMDVTLPMGVTLKKAQLTDRSNGHLVSVSQTGEGRYRIVGISLQNEAFEGTMGDLLRLQLDGDSHGMTIDNVLFATPQGVQHELAGIADATRMGASLNDKGQMINDKLVFDLQGRKVVPTAKGLYIVNGKKAVVK